MKNSQLILYNPPYVHIQRIVNAVSVK